MSEGQAGGTRRRWPLFGAGLRRLPVEELADLASTTSWTPRSTKQLLKYLVRRGRGWQDDRMGNLLARLLARSPHLDDRQLCRLIGCTGGRGLRLDPDETETVTVLLAHPHANDTVAIAALALLCGKGSDARACVDWGRHLAPIALHLRGSDGYIGAPWPGVLSEAIQPTLEQLRALVDTDASRLPVLLNLGPSWTGTTAELVDTVRAVAQQSGASCPETGSSRTA